MYQLSQIFKKYLREYASKILESRTPKMIPAQSTLGMYQIKLFQYGKHNFTDSF